jgi:hypothetical protein
MNLFNGRPSPDPLSANRRGMPQGGPAFEVDDSPTGLGDQAKHKGV